MPARPQWRAPIAQSELERRLAGIGGELSDEQRQLLGTLGRAIVDKLLHGPNRCLCPRASGDKGLALSDAAVRLFGLGR